MKEELDYWAVVLRSGVTIPLTQERFDDFIELYTKYVGAPARNGDIVIQLPLPDLGTNMLIRMDSVDAVYPITKKVV